MTAASLVLSAKLLMKTLLLATAPLVVAHMSVLTSVLLA